MRLMGVSSWLDVFHDPESKVESIWKKIQIFSRFKYIPTHLMLSSSLRNYRHTECFRSAHDPKRTRVVHYGLFWGVEGAGDPAEALEHARQTLYC